MPATNERLDFKLTNKTGYTIAQLFIGPTHGPDEWGDNILGPKQQIADGQTLDIEFDPKARAELWDMKVVYVDDDTFDVRRLDLASINEIILHWDDEAEETTVTVK